MPGLQRRGLTAWLTLGLVASSATFAVWTSAGGLETRQFTLFIVAAVVCLAVHRSSSWGLLASSFSLAGAALTRPEGLLIAAICFSWFVGQQRFLDALPGVERRGYTVAGVVWRLVKGLNWREIAYLVAPFAVLIAGHFLFRYAYYGEWLPNTYYAKFVRPWWGSRYPLLCGGGVRDRLIPAAAAGNSGGLAALAAVWRQPVYAADAIGVLARPLCDAGGRRLF